MFSCSVLSMCFCRSAFQILTEETNSSGKHPLEATQVVNHSFPDGFLQVRMHETLIKIHVMVAMTFLSSGDDQHYHLAPGSIAPHGDLL